MRPEAALSRESSAAAGHRGRYRSRRTRLSDAGRNPWFGRRDHMADSTPRESGGEAAPETGWSAVEQLIDDIVDDSFPASDPPTWGVAASRLERWREADRGVETSQPDHSSGHWRIVCATGMRA